MPFNGARAEEEPGADVGVREALASQARDQSLLGGEDVAGRNGPRTHFLPSCKQLTPGPLGECLHSDRHELVVGGTELVTCVDPAVLAAQPLPIEQMRPGKLGTPPDPCQPS